MPPETSAPETAAATMYTDQFTLADEGVHPAGNDNPDWSESFFCSWYDAEQGIGGCHRAGQELNNGHANYWYGLMSKEGWRYRFDGQEFPLTDADRTPHGLGTTSEDGSHHLMFDDEGIGRLHVIEGDTEVDLRIENYHPMSAIWDLGDTEDDSAHVEDTMAHHHYEGSGKATGTVKANGQTYEIDALCHRDHSWGPREWKGFNGHRWVVGGFGPERSVSGLIATTTAGDETTGGVVQTGFLANGTDVTHAAHLDCLVYLESDGVTHRGGEATFYMPDGETVRIEMKPVNGVMFQTREYIESAQLCEATDDEGREGYCYFEISTNTRMGKFPLQHTIGSAWTRGRSEVDGSIRPGTLRGLT